MQGHVYIMQNKGLIENLYKIGMTSRSPEDRAKDLSKSTSIPQPFEIVYSKRFENVKEAERWTHREFTKYRYGKEFFKIPNIQEVIQFLDHFDEKKIIPFIMNSSSEFLRINSAFSQEFANESLDHLWEKCYPNSKNLHWLKQYHLEFCNRLTLKILSLSGEMIVRFNDRSFSFDDEIDFFFDILPQKNKVTIAPLRLTQNDLRSIGCKFRDVSNKKYRMGGLVRVDLLVGNDNDLNLAYELAKKSFNSKQKIETWNLLNRVPRPRI